jgi:hypothetical protein
MAATTAVRILRSIPVSHEASESLRAAIPAGNLKAFAREFLDLLEKPARRLRKLQGDDTTAAWSAADEGLSGRERTLAAGLDQFWAAHRSGKHRSKTRRAVQQLLAEWSGSLRQAPRAWEALAVSEFLLLHGDIPEPATFAACIAVLARLKSAPFEAAGPAGTLSPQAMVSTASLSEASLIVALLLSPLGDHQLLLESGESGLRQALQQTTDGDGRPHGSLLTLLPGFLTVLARPTAWAAAFRHSLWGSELQQRISGLTTSAAMLAAPLQPATETDIPTCRLSVASPLLLLTKSLLPPQAGRLQKLLVKLQRPVKKIRNIKPWKVAPAAETSTEQEADHSASAETLQPAWQSDAACCAVLRSSADPDADIISVDWHAGQIQLQAYTAGTLLLSGPWHWSARLNDAPENGPVAWKCSCWFDDPECVFIELEGEQSGAVKCVRQIMLARRERFAIFTDTVSTGSEQPRVQLTTALPFAEGVMAVPDTVTRELQFSRGPATIRALPLWLDDDRLQHPFGSCAVHDGQLEMTAPGNGGTCLPLALDWNPRRSDRPADWARLMVTENRRHCGSHEAAGFRVRVGDFQVLLYRSLQNPGQARAVLGLHTWDESVYTRVPGRETPMEGLVEVESPE